MAEAKVKPDPPALLVLMESKTATLMKARTFADMGMAEPARPIWVAAAASEERIAPLLDALGRDLEAAASRISAASCYQKGGDLNRPANLYQAALAGPLRPNTRRDVEAMLAGCLDELSRTALNGSSRREGEGGGRIVTGVGARGRRNGTRSRIRRDLTGSLLSRWNTARSLPV
jgi:hypothetical protein